MGKPNGFRLIWTRVQGSRTHVRVQVPFSRQSLTGWELSVHHGGVDNRSRGVESQKSHRELANFPRGRTVRDGVRQLRVLFERIQSSADTYYVPAFTRLKRLKCLQATGRIDRDLRWS